VRNYALLVIVFNVIFGFTTTGVNNVAHLGGLVAGAGFGAFVPPLHSIGGRDLSLVERAVLIAAIVAGALAVAVAAGDYVTANGLVSPGLCSV
jgi:hypothetical protein